jgi:hypothetical protein
MLFSDDILHHWTLLGLAKALSAELAAPVHPTDGPPWLAKNLARPVACPVPDGARYVHEHLLVFHHRLLLDSRIMEAVPAAIRKVLRQRIPGE